MVFETARTDPSATSDLTEDAGVAPVVSVVKTNPETVISDIGLAMRLAGYNSHISREVATVLKVNISWQHFYPGCSTSPWQLDGVLKTLQEDGFTDLIPTHNGTVVVDAKEGEINNKHDVVARSNGVESVHLEDVEWVPLPFEEDFLVLNKIYHE